MKNVFNAGVRRSIASSLGRFLAIAVIVALGTGFYAGLRMTGPDMRLAADRYFDGTAMADLRVVSTMGLSDANIDALADIEGVAAVMPAREIDTLSLAGDNQCVVRFQTFDVQAAAASDTSDGKRAVSDDDAYLNRPILVSGSWPVAPGECVLLEGAVLDAPVSIGDTVQVLEGTQDVDETLAARSYTVTGFVRCSYYASPSSIGTTSLGSGYVEQVAFVGDEAFAADAPYSEAFVSVAGAADKQTGTDAYQAEVDAVAQRIEQSGLAAARLAEVRDQGHQELDAARADMERGQAEAAARLDDGAAALDEAKRQVDDAAARLEDGQAQLDAAGASLAWGEQRLEQGRAAYDAGSAELAQQRATAEEQLAQAQAAIDEAQAGYDRAAAARDELSGKRDAAAQGLAAADAAVDAYLPGIEQALSAADAAIAALEERLDALDPSDPDYEAEASALREQLAQAHAQRDGLQSRKEGLLSQQAQAAQAVQRLDAAIAALDAQMQGVPEQLAAARDELAARTGQAAQAFAAAQTGLDAAQGAIAEGEEELVAGYRAYAQGEARLADGRAAFEQGRASYEQGAAAYEEGRRAAQDGLAEAEQRIADAQASLDALEEPEIMVLDRTKNMGAESFKSDASRIDRIAMVFPFIFFLVAALVALTTMTRMVEEERVLIGTYKALGYSNARIVSKYLAYAVVASGVGALVGIVALSLFLPYFIMNAYAIMYDVPVRPTPIDPGLALLSAGLGVGITVAATWFAAASTLRESPAALMLPRAPKAGKRIFLERIKPLWRRMSFSWKVTARNIFRYKRRFFMAVIGIAGCTALLLTGLGLQNAINDIIDKQFGDIYRYNTVVRAADDISAEDAAVLDAALAADCPEGSIAAHTENMLAARPDDPRGEQQRFELVVPRDPARMADFVDMRERIGGDPIALGDDGVVISEKLANELGLKTGDAVALFAEDAAGNASGDAREVRIAAVMENYVGQYVFAAPSVFAALSDEDPVYSTVYAIAVDDLDRRAAFSDELLALDGVKTVGFNDETIDSYRTMLKSVDAVVVVLVIAAAALAFVVLYNLTNINITERQREIATLKVLGFNPREVNAYIYRETLILSAVGALVGCVLGVFMEGFVVTTAEVDQVMFGREIHAMSYIIAFALTMLFSALVMFFMRKKLAGIDMVESLKSVE